MSLIHNTLPWAQTIVSGDKHVLSSHNTTKGCKTKPPKMKIKLSKIESYLFA